MGSKFTLPKYNHIISMFIEDHWIDVTSQLLPKNQIKPILKIDGLSQRKIYESILGDQKVQLHKTFLRSQEEVKDYMQTLSWRKQCVYLVQAKMIRFKELQGKCQCNSFLQTELFVQYVPYRLSQLSNIPFPFNLYLLREVIQAFRFLYFKDLMIDFDEDLVFVTDELKIKTWLHYDLASIQPSMKYQESSISNQSYLINKIITSVAKRTEKNCVGDIKSYLGCRKNMNFSYVLQGIEQFAQKFNTKVPQSLSYLDFDDFLPSQIAILTDRRSQQTEEKQNKTSKSMNTTKNTSTSTLIEQNTFYRKNQKFPRQNQQNVASKIDSIFKLTDTSTGKQFGSYNMRNTIHDYDCSDQLSLQSNRRKLSTQHTIQYTIQHVQTKAEVQIVNQFRQNQDCKEGQRPVLNQSIVNINVGRQSVLDNTGNGKCHNYSNRNMRNTQFRKHFDLQPAVSKEHSDHKSPLFSIPDVDVVDIRKRQNEVESSTLNEKEKRQNQAAFLFILSNK